jgi:hypothetical protein
MEALLLLLDAAILIVVFILTIRNGDPDMPAIGPTRPAERKFRKGPPARDQIANRREG